MCLHVGQYTLPVAPRVPAVTHPVLQRDVAFTHQRVEIHVALPKEVVVTAVDPPADRPYGFEFFVAHCTEKPDRRVVDHRALEVILVVAGSGEDVEQAAHRAGRAEEVGVVQRIGGRAAASHREPRDGTVPLVCKDAVVTFDAGDELLEEEAFILPARDIEVTHVASGVVLALARSVGHDDHHRTGGTRGDGLVGNLAHVAFHAPVRMASGGAVQQVEDRVAACRVAVVAVGQIDRAGLVGVEDRAVQRQGFQTALGRQWGSSAEHCRKCQQTFHIR